jgi:hypothetical protein
LENPVADSTRGYGAAAHPIKNPLTRQVAELFDAVYFLMLQALAFAFTPAMDAEASARSAGAAIELMTTVIRPIGDALTNLPAGVGDLTAGPAFGLTRFLPWPADPGLAVTLLRQRLDELGVDADRLAGALPAVPHLEIAAARLHDIARRCSP